MHKFCRECCCLLPLTQTKTSLIHANMKLNKINPKVNLQILIFLLVILNGTPLQYSCLENPMDGGAWWAAVHGVAKSQTQLSDFTFTFHFHALEKEMATHSSIPAWRIPGIGEPGGLLSMGVAQSRTQLKRLSSSSSSRNYHTKQSQKEKDKYHIISLICII